MKFACDAILAMDPGKKTGIAFHDLTTDEHEFLELDTQETGAFLHNCASVHGNGLQIVSESFIITVNTAKNTQAPWSLELIGVARYMSQAYCRRELILQQPASAKRFSSDARLKLMGYHTRGLAGHANDAARHLLLFEATHGILGTELLQKLSDNP